MLAGRTIVNSFKSEQSAAVGVEYRHRIRSYLDGSVSWLYEGDNRLIRRNGIMAELWAVSGFFDDRLTLGFGAGAYFNVDSYRHLIESGDTHKLVSGVVSLTGSYLITPKWDVRSTWHRIVTDYDRDTDVLLGGVGYRF